MNEPTWYVGMHPRVYGADKYVIISRYFFIDASPRMRGRTCSLSRIKRNKPIHPRVYRADWKELQVVRGNQGSSPVYTGGGKLQKFSSPLNNHRRIPVYTGQIPSCPSSLVSIKIHPRVYGADTKSLKQVRRVGRQAFFVPASYDKISMHHFSQMYFCG